uniref:Uncharacterized protein n=1 Tax=Anguilla anguilla TaxID=7936 RepID=A0A0E9X195_ANGAN
MICCSCEMDFTRCPARSHWNGTSYGYSSASSTCSGLVEYVQIKTTLCR